MGPRRGVAAAAACGALLVLSGLSAPVLAAAAPSRAPTARTATPRAAAALDRPYAAPAVPGVRVRVISDIHFDTIDDVTATSKGTHCDVEGDLYLPSTATRAHPAPAILTTNGFGGNKNDQAGFAEQFALRGYVVLSYTGLGFGPELSPSSIITPGSGCKIELDSPQWDGQAGDQLLQFLGGRPHVAYASYNPTTGAYADPIPAPPVLSDTPRTHLRYDPRVGMIGGSYGGEIQFAVADDDPRLDAIVPIITWNDLAYSLAPNNTSLPASPANPASVTYTTPGVEKFDWVSLFFGEGIVDGIGGAQVDPSRDVGCPNFDNQACVSKAQLDAQGYPDPTTLAFARQASVESYLDHIHIPTLLMQGQADSLFNLHEAAATYLALRARKVPVEMIWQSWGHSDGTPAAGEDNPNANPLSTYEGTIIAAWFDKYLKDDPRANPGADFQYYEDWKPAVSHGPDTDQYALAASYPVVNHPALFQLSGTSALVPAGTPVSAGTATFATSANPTSYSETSAVQGNEIPNQDSPAFDTPGFYASYESAPLSRAVVQVGSPVLRIRLTAPVYAASEATGPAGEVALFAKLYDVSPSGTKTLVHRLVSPFRVADVNQTIQVLLPAVVHRYPAGDRLDLVVAASDAAYRDNDVAATVGIVTSPAQPDSLSIPLLAASSSQPVTSVTVVARHPATRSRAPVSATSSSSGAQLADTGLPVEVPAAALLALVGALLLRRRVRRSAR